MKTLSLRERLRETTSAAILDAAEVVAASDGLAEANLQAIAQHAGIAVGTIYNYFADRQTLFEQLFVLRRRELFESIEAAAKALAHAPFEDQLRGFVRAVFAHFDARRTFLRLVFDSEQHRPAVIKGNDGKRRPSTQELLGQAERTLSVGVRQRKLREDRAKLHAVVLVAILRGVLMSRVDSDEPLVSETDTVLSLFLHGAAR